MHVDSYLPEESMMLNSKPPQALSQHVVSQLVVNHLSFILDLYRHNTHN